MFERFADRARQVVVLAQDEARLLKHNYIGTEHLLLGVLREQDGVGARALDSLDVTLDEVRAAVTTIVGRGERVTSGQIPFTPRAKKVLELSVQEARAVKHNYITTEHLLLALVREKEGVAARVLRDFGADPDTVRERVLELATGSKVEEAGSPSVAVSWPAHTRRRDLVPLAAFALGALVLGLGILIGWAIWGT